VLAVVAGGTLPGPRSAMVAHRSVAVIVDDDADGPGLSR
jgi:hypothetical protein